MACFDSGKGERMEEHNRIETVKCTSADTHPISAMGRMSVKTVQSFLKIMGIEYEKGLPAEAYLMAWHEEFCGNREWVLLMLPKPYLLLLLEIWDSDTVEMDPIRWDMIQNLKMFGFLNYRRGNDRNHMESEIFVNLSMKQNFFFLLKSRESRKKMDRYDKWENALLGMLYYYGIVPMNDLHSLFREAVGEEISYDRFVTFVRCRADLWGHGTFLKDRKKQEFFMIRNVESAELTLLMIREHQDLPYKRTDYYDLEYVRNGFGIDNRWDGVSELGSFLVQDMDMSYYRSTVLVHTILVSIQNGMTLEKILEKIGFISFYDEEDRKTAEKYVNIMYESIPVYEYKGYSRSEYRKICLKNDRNKRRKRFTMLPGGKQES